MWDKDGFKRLRPFLVFVAADAWDVFLQVLFVFKFVVLVTRRLNVCHTKIGPGVAKSTLSVGLVTTADRVAESADSLCRKSGVVVGEKLMTQSAGETSPEMLFVAEGDPSRCFIFSHVERLNVAPNQ